MTKRVGGGVKNHKFVGVGRGVKIKNVVQRVLIFQIVVIVQIGQIGEIVQIVQIAEIGQLGLLCLK